MLYSPVLSGQQKLVHFDGMAVATRMRCLLHLLLFISLAQAALPFIVIAIDVAMLRHDTHAMTPLRVTCCLGVLNCSTRCTSRKLIVLCFRACHLNELIGVSCKTRE
jgi:hypothetical protein